MRAVLLPLIFPFFVGCIYYSMAGSIPPHIKSIAIPLAENQTAEFGMSAVAITDKANMMGAFHFYRAIKNYNDQNEDKIIKHIKLKANVTKKQLTKTEAEKLLKEENERQMKQYQQDHSHDHGHSNDKKSTAAKKTTSPQTSKTTVKKTPKTKKVSKK